MPSCWSATTPACPEETLRWQRCLHDKAALVDGLPLDEQRPVFKAKAGRLFSDVDIDSRTGEESGDDKRELSGEHGSSSYAERLCR